MGAGTSECIAECVQSIWNVPMTMSRDFGVHRCAGPGRPAPAELVLLGHSWWRRPLGLRQPHSHYGPFDLQVPVNTIFTYTERLLFCNTAKHSLNDT
jgi:hypothetical protein